MKSRIPEPKPIHAFTVTGHGLETLGQPHLADAALQEEFLDAQRWDKYNRSNDPVAEKAAAREVAISGLIRYADRLTRQPSKESREQFTKASIELYGEPDKAVVVDIVRKRLHDLDNFGPEQQKEVNFLREFYSDQLKECSEETFETEIDQNTVIEKLGESLQGRYGQIFEYIDGLDSDENGPENLTTVFEEVLNWLSHHDDPGFSDWKVDISEGTSTAVNTDEKTIIVAKNKPPVSRKQLKLLVTHEILTHVKRSVNGYKKGKLLGTGLPDYIDAEEGLATLSEKAVAGDYSEKDPVHYHLIAFALGSLNGKQMTRGELFMVARAEAILAESKKEKEVDYQKIEDKCWKKVARYYRGSKGEDNADGTQAIFTKDIAYYQGYIKVVGFINEKLAAGHSIDDIHDYLTQGKFDPTNPSHTAFEGLEDLR